MTQTSTHRNGCDAAIWLDNAAGTPTDISGSTNAYNLDFKVNIGATPTFGTQWPRRLMCGRDASFSVTVLFTTAADEGYDLLKDWFFGNVTAARTLTFYLPDKNVGSDKYSGEVVLETLSIPVTAGEGAPILVSATFLPDGAWTMVTNAT